MMRESSRDIYSADFSKAIGLPGIGEKSIKALENGIKESKDRPFATVLSSLGIAEIGKKGAEMLIAGGFDDIDKLIAAAKDGSIEPFVSIAESVRQLQRT